MHVSSFCTHRKIYTNRSIFPEWDLPPNDLKGKIHAVTQELKEYEIKLKGAQTEARKRRKILDKEWADLELKETEFKNTFIRYNKFVRENVEKRERWICKMKNDKISTENKEKQIEKLQTQYDHILSIKQKMESMIEKHLIYEVSKNNCLCIILKYFCM